MSQNFNSNESTTGTTGGAGTGAGNTSTSHDTSTGLSTTGGSATGGGQSSGAGTGTATGLAAQAQQYKQKVTDAAVQAKDYVTDKASVVGEKFQDLRAKDFGQVAEEAREYARQKPGQALLISAAAGFVIGLLLRGSNRR